MGQSPYRKTGTLLPHYVYRITIVGKTTQERETRWKDSSSLKSSSSIYEFPGSHPLNWIRRTRLKDYKLLKGWNKGNFVWVGRKIRVSEPSIPIIRRRLSCVRNFDRPKVKLRVDTLNDHYNVFKRFEVKRGHILLSFYGRICQRLFIQSNNIS